MNDAFLHGGGGTAWPSTEDLMRQAGRTVPLVDWGTVHAAGDPNEYDGWEWEAEEGEVYRLPPAEAAWRRGMSCATVSDQELVQLSRAAGRLDDLREHVRHHQAPTATPPEPQQHPSPTAGLSI